MVATERGGGKALASLPWLVSLVLAVIVFAYAALLPLGRWQGDEYLEASFVRDYGFAYLPHRLFGASPRPLSELVLSGYFFVVTTVGRSFTRPFLLTHWGLVAASCFITTHRRHCLRQSLRITVGMALAAMFFLSGGVYQLFFWPAGAAPYLETLSGVALSLLLIIDGRDQSRAGVVCASLAALLAATSSEAGAMFAAPYAALRLVTVGRQRTPHRGFQAAAWLLPGLTAALILVAIVISQRVAASGSSVTSMMPLQRATSSLIRAMSDFPSDLLGVEDLDSRPLAAVYALIEKILFFAGMRLCLRQVEADAGRQTKLLVFTVAILIAAFGMLASGEYVFGAACCSRHGALRQCWYALAIVAGAALTSPSQASKRSTWLGPVLLLLALGLPFTLAIPALNHDYGILRAARVAENRTWQSGYAPGDSMTFYPSPRGDIVGGAELPPGVYSMSNNPPWYAYGLMLFFHKRIVDIKPQQ